MDARLCRGTCRVVGRHGSGGGDRGMKGKGRKRGEVSDDPLLKVREARTCTCVEPHWDVT